jgi:hypothetical protein
MSSKEKFLKIIYLDCILESLFVPILWPVYAFYVTQKVNPLLLGYAMGMGSLVDLVLYYLLDRKQDAKRKELGDDEYIYEMPFYMAILAVIIDLLQVFCYIIMSLNYFYFTQIITGSVVAFVFTNNYRYMYRVVLTTNERELVERKLSKCRSILQIVSIALLFSIDLEPSKLSPIRYLALFYITSEIGAIITIIWFHTCEQKFLEDRAQI